MPQISEVLEVAEAVFSRGKGRRIKGGPKGKGPDAAIEKLNQGINKALDKVAKKLLGRDAVPPPSPYPQPGLPPQLNPAKKPFPAPKPDPAPKPQPQPGRQGAGPRVGTQQRTDPGQTGKGVVRMSDALRIVALYSVPAMRETAQRVMLAQQLGQSNPREKVTLAPLYPGEPTRYVHYRISGPGIDRTDDDVVEFVTSQPPGDALA